MLKIAQFKQEILSPILAIFTKDQSLANAYCVIWAIDAYATHMALDGYGTPENAEKLEPSFKKNVAKISWQFRLIQEASNATKHGIRQQRDAKKRATDVSKSSDVKPDIGTRSYYAYFNNVDGGVTIDADWEYRPSEKAYFDDLGKRVEGFNGPGPTIYLARIIEDAIEAIEHERGNSAT